VLRDIQLPSNPVALDIGCGDGITTIALYERCDKQGTVYGIDIAQRMIDKSNENQRKAGYGDIRFMKMDAESLDFPDEMFDVVMSLFTLQFLPDKRKALSEILRVLKRGGRLGLFVPAGNMQYESLEIFRRVSERHPELTRLVSVLHEYEQMHLNLEGFQDLLASVGFSGLDIFGRHRIFFEEAMKYLETNPYPADLLLSVPPELRKQIRGEVADEMAAISDPRGFKLTYYNIMGYAQKS
jgi:ubiquinone/menaquinone biosynthesis C-methylase UbiE